MTMTILFCLQDSCESTATYSQEKAKNENFNMDEFNTLSLSDNESESKKDSDSGTESEGKEWPHDVIVNIVSRNLHNQFSKKQRTKLGSSMLDEFLQESCKLVLDSTFLNDDVSGHATSDNKKARNNSINYSSKILEDSRWKKSQ